VRAGANTGVGRSTVLFSRPTVLFRHKGKEQ
jgi:hypothetical protein